MNKWNIYQGELWRVELRAPHKNQRNTNLQITHYALGDVFSWLFWIHPVIYNKIKSHNQVWLWIWYLVTNNIKLIYSESCSLS